MKKTATILLAALLVFAGCSHDLPIKTKVPPRPAGVTDVLGLTVPAMDTVHVGFVGLGMRGSDAVVRYTYVPGAEITAICDVEPGRVEASQRDLAERGCPPAAAYSGSEDSYRQLCENPDVDLVYICTDWVHHVPVALCAMEHGKHVAIEVPSAYSLEDCWALVDMAEKTRLHCMILENCCYDFFELSALQMAREGLFGEVVHAEGSYCHNLDPYWDAYWSNWRLDFNKEHRGDVYPTHGFGPVCQVLDIHRGDRLKTLVALDTKAFNGPKHVAARGGADPEDFANGDVSTTMIKTEKGKTVLIEHDVMTPRPYSRMYQLVGTEGYAAKYPVGQLCFRREAMEGGKADYRKLQGEEILTGEKLSAFMERHRSPILTPELEALAKEVGGHGGMDFIMDYRLIYCLRNGLPLDMDVYDLAEWCSIGELSAISMENGGAPVEVPDFTRGAWDRIKGFSYAFAE